MRSALPRQRHPRPAFTPGLYLPFLRDLLHTQPLTGLDLAVVFLASTLGYAAIRPDRVLFRRKRPASPHDASIGHGPEVAVRRV